MVVAAVHLEETCRQVRARGPGAGLGAGLEPRGKVELEMVAAPSVVAGAGALGPCVLLPSGSGDRVGNG